MWILLARFCQLGGQTDSKSELSGDTSAQPYHPQENAQQPHAQSPMILRVSLWGYEGPDWLKIEPKLAARCKGNPHPLAIPL